MKQILHIFRKDTRRFWLEILLSLAIMTALVCVYPLQWSGPPVTVWASDNARNIELEVLVRGLVALVMASWAILIARVIHAESLVGERQFWLTRPYEWKKLLAAKLLFLLMFLYLPLLAAQYVLLAEAGLASFASLSGLFFNLFLITGIIVLPLIAIATVTANFFAMAITLFGVVLALFGAIVALFIHTEFGNTAWALMFLAIGDPFSSRQAATIGSHHAQPWIALLLLTICGAVVMLQYSLRRTRVSRAILLALPVVLGVAAVVAHQRTLSGQALMDRMYPALAAGNMAPVQFSFAPIENHTFYVSRGENPVGITLPIRVSGIADGVAVFAENERVTIEAVDGYSWSTEVTDYNPQRLGAANRGMRVGFFMPHTIYDRFKSSPVTLRVTFGITQLQATGSEHIAMPTHDVAVPGFGVCGGPYVGYGLIKCRSALREPPLTYVSADWSSTPCPASQTAMEEVRGEFWVGEIGRNAAEFGVSPIAFSGVTFMPDLNNATGGKYLCPGAPITFTQYRLAGRMQTSLVVANLQLPED
jgi:hypothetical protein